MSVLYVCGCCLDPNLQTNHLVLVVVGHDIAILQLQYCYFEVMEAPLRSWIVLEDKEEAGYSPSDRGLLVRCAVTPALYLLILWRNFPARCAPPNVFCPFS